MSRVLRPETLADRLGQVKAEIAILAEKEAAIKEALIDSGVEAAEGKLFRVTVSRFERSSLDYKGLVEKLQPSPQLLKAHTTVKSQVAVKVTARNGNGK